MSSLMQRGRTLIASAPAALTVFGIAILPAFMLSVRGAAFLSFSLLLVAAFGWMLSAPAPGISLSSHTHSLSLCTYASWGMGLPFKSCREQSRPL